MRISVFVHPNSKKPRVDQDLLGVLHIYVKEPPLEGKANRAVIDALAEYYQVARSQIVLIRGEKSKIKFFDVSI